MKLLWVKSDFLHPTTRGGQIRTLEIVKRLHKRHEVHYIAYENPGNPEGLDRAHEYCTKAYPVSHDVPPHASVKFVAPVGGQRVFVDAAGPQPLLHSGNAATDCHPFAGRSSSTA